MPELTIEEVQAIIGKLTFNYELQISRMEKHIRDLKASLDAKQVPDIKKVK